MPLLETKWLAILIAEPFCHWAGAVCYRKQHKFGGGGQFPTGWGQFAMDNSISGVGAFCHWMGAVCHGKQQTFGGGHFVTVWGQFAMDNSTSGVGGILSLDRGSLPWKIAQAWGAPLSCFTCPSKQGQGKP